MRTNQVGIFCLLVVILVLGSPASNAQSGGGYDLTWNTMDGGGGLSSGGDYSVHGTIGQPDAGVMSGGDYSLQGGFWSGACAPPDVVTPTITLVNNDIQLSWLPVNNADSYTIYRDNAPYFEATTVYDGATSSPWLDPGAAANPAINHFYLIRAVGCGESVEGRRVGEFDFAITPGTGI